MEVSTRNGDRKHKLDALNPSKPVPAVSHMDGESRKNSKNCFRSFSDGRVFENIEKFDVFDFKVDRKRRTAVWKPYAIEALLFSFPMAETARLYHS